MSKSASWMTWGSLVDMRNQRVDLQIYLMDLSCLREQGVREEFLRHAFEMVDETRQNKAIRIKSKEAQCVSLGAGLLLQKMVLDYRNRILEDGVRRLTAIELLEELLEERKDTGLPLMLAYQEGEQGKPVMKGFPLQFNISHSGDYVLLAVAECAVGVDIQRHTRVDFRRLSKRFFSPREVQELTDCDSEADARALYFRLWTQKEAYGKLKGCGIFRVLHRDMKELTGVEWICIESVSGYTIHICKEV